jgi:hypothetical protein
VTPVNAKKTDRSHRLTLGRPLASRYLRALVGTARTGLARGESQSWMAVYLNLQCVPTTQSRQPIKAFPCLF